MENVDVTFNKKKKGFNIYNPEYYYESKTLLLCRLIPLLN